MDRTALLTLMAFTDFAWSDVEESFRSDNDILVKAAPGSGWPALRNCLAHILLGRERWNNAIIGLKSSPVPDLADDALRTWDDLNAYREQTGSRLTSFIDDLDEAALQASHECDIDGSPLQYTRADLILHLVLHEVSHHGDISTLMFQLGREPWVPYYRFFANPDA